MGWAPTGGPARIGYRRAVGPRVPLRRGAKVISGLQVTVKSVLHPVGPLPASVYWRRRAVALAAVLVVGVLFTMLLSGGGAGGDPRLTSAAGSSPGPSGSATSSPGTITATPPSVDPGRPDDGNTNGDGSAAPGQGDQSGSGATRTAAVAPPRQCDNHAVMVTIAPRQPVYRVGEKPVLRLAVRNVSKYACVRDLGAAQQEVLLYSGGTRLWSSNDCYPGGSRDVRTLQPGEQATFSVVWSGLSSRPHCVGVRTRVPAGQYALVGRLASKFSSRARLVLR
jgi:hypothetical protein